VNPGNFRDPLDFYIFTPEFELGGRRHPDLNPKVGDAKVVARRPLESIEAAHGRFE
jgi:hypothetical protein